MSIKKKIFGLSHTDRMFRNLDVSSDDIKKKEHLMQIVKSLIKGYNFALEAKNGVQLVNRIENELNDHQKGFAFEGTGMYFALMDLIFPKKYSRLRKFTEQEGISHDFIITVGAGFAIARVPWGLKRMQTYVSKLDPLMAWCLPDGYGFHQGIFYPKQYIEECKEAPKLIPDYFRCVFDSGIGRSMWWVKAANPIQIKKAIDRFPVDRQAELWGGIGVASTYAGGISKNELLQLWEISGDFRADFLSGIPSAATMRQRGKNPSLWTDEACLLLLGRSSKDVSDIVHEIIEDRDGKLKTDQEKLEKGYTEVRKELKLIFEEHTSKIPGIIIN